MGNEENQFKLAEGTNIYKVVGTRPVRPDGIEKVTGRANFGADMSLPGMLTGRIVRSPHAAAKIKSVDASGAYKVPGVVKVMDGREADEHINPITHYIDPAVFGGQAATIRCLALDDVWCYGQPVAVVVAQDKKTAQYAAQRVQVDYELLDPIIEIDDAIAPDARIVAEG